MKSVTRQGTKIAGVVALIVAGAVFAYTLVDAVRVDPVEAGAPLQLEVAELPAGVAAEASRSRGGSVGTDAADRAVPWREGRGGARAPAGARSETGDDAQAVREATPERSARSSPVRVRGSERAPADAEATRLAEAMQEALSFRGAATSTDELLDLAVANDPFRPDRRPGPAYVMPWERRTPAPRREEEDDDDEPEWPELRVVGFALTQNGGAALVQHDEDMPILLAMGERIRGYELVEVDTLSGGGATLVGPAGQIRFPVREPRIDDDDDRRRRRRRGDDDDNDRRRAQQQVQEQMQRVQEVLRRQLQQGGGNAVIRLRGGGGPELMNLAPAPRWEWGLDTAVPAQWDWDFDWAFREPPEYEAPAVGGTRTSGPGVGEDR